jgi:hypothetical protein
MSASSTQAGAEHPGPASAFPQHPVAFGVVALVISVLIVVNVISGA